MRSAAGGSAAEASVDRSESVIQAAAPSDRATAAKARVMVSDHPLRRRDNGRSAIAASKAIRSPINTTPDARPTPQGFVGQSRIMQPEVRHNRDKRGCSSLLSFGNPDPLRQVPNASTIRRFGANGTNRRHPHCCSVTRPAADVHLADDLWRLIRGGDSGPI